MSMGDLTIVRRSLAARRFSTVTTILLVGVSVGLMLLLVSMRQAARGSFSRGTGTMHALLSRESSPMLSVLNSVYYAGPPQAPINWADYQKLLTSYPFEWAIPTQLGDSYRGRPVMATTREFLERFEPAPGEPWRLAEGRLFEASFEIVAGAEAAATTGLSPGDRINLWHGGPRDPNAHVHDEYTYTVVGILAPSATPHDRALFTDLDSTWILHAHDRRARDPAVTSTTIDDITDADRKITGVYIRLAGRPGAGGMPAAAPGMLTMMRQRDGYTVAEPRAEVDRLFAIVSNVDQILLGMAAAVMVSGAIAVMLALYNSMEQRRRQIALLRVLGATRLRLFRLVLAESLAIGLGGALVGIALAAIGGALVAGVLEARLGLVVKPSLSPLPTLVVAGATLALAALAGLVPAVSAYRTSVVRNLRPLG